MQQLTPTTIPQSLARPNVPAGSQAIPQHMPQSPQQMPGQQAQTVQLNDIHLPEQISDFPVAFGWWFLALITLVLFIVSLYEYLAYRKLTKDKKQALKMMQQNEPNAMQSLTILKWAAMQYLPRQQVAKLYGGQLQQFLSALLADKPKIQRQFDDLSQGQFELLYQGDVGEQTNPELNQAITLWLSHALPQKKTAQHATLVSKNNHKNIAGVQL